MSAYTVKNLGEVKDSAAEFGVEGGYTARFAREDLECQATGFSLQTVPAGTRAPFAHRHENAEEVYVVINGSGRMLLGEEVVDVKRLDAVRVDPGVVRTFEAGTDGLQILVFGPHHEGDGEMTQAQWPRGSVRDQP